MHQDCLECKRVWEEFSEATKAHIAILGKVQLANIEQNSAALAGLERLKLGAAERRRRARVAFKEHEATHRNEKARPQTA
jgi:hypothetical protein